MPSSAFACSLSPSQSLTLTHGLIDIAFGFALLFFSSRLLFRGNAFVQPVFYSLLAVVLGGSFYTIVFRSGLSTSPGCETEFGQFTVVFFILASVISLLFASTFLIQNILVKQSVGKK